MSKKFAFLDENNIVKQVLLFEEYDENLLNQVKNSFSFNTFVESQDNNPAHVDGEYFNNKFYPPKPYQSWIRNEELSDWEAPIPYPIFDEENPKYYEWNEGTLNWEEIQVS